ncbi:hypothetical protein [Streptomyces sp. SID5910]|uniref:hypothetical protein n=1 Tax=Streptomyces sp. SID5910 TaxID=2690312 RepID=UPI0013692876|nr:hypothetical protein [Streptomyces sp. SID5910]MYR42496.1 hypothetical protein [Streptomyces sp. SID5910]
MGSLKVTLCAGAALAAVCAPVAPTAYAADGRGVSVTPASPAPGTDVTLRVPDCTERTAVAVSAAFETDVRLSVAAEDGVLAGSTRVRASVTAGVYAVRVTCGEDARQGTLTVQRRHRPTAPASPVAPVDAGGGGAAELAAPDTGDGARVDAPGAAHTVTGLVLAGIAAVAVGLRGVRSRSRRAD